MFVCVRVSEWVYGGNGWAWHQYSLTTGEFVSYYCIQLYIFFSSISYLILLNCSNNWFPSVLYFISTVDGQTRNNFRFIIFIHFHYGSISRYLAPLKPNQSLNMFYSIFLGLFKHLHYDTATVNLEWVQFARSMYVFMHLLKDLRNIFLPSNVAFLFF